MAFSARASRAPPCRRRPRCRPRRARRSRRAPLRRRPPPSSRSITSTPWAAARASRSGTRSTPMTRQPLRRPIRVASWPTGPSPKTARVSPAGDVGVPNGLPGRGQDVGEVEVALVGHALGHLDRPELRLRHAQQLGLPARHRAVQRRVAEQGRALALLAHLGGLALGVQAARAHPAGPAGDVERHDDPVADLQVAGLGAALHDHAHGLVAEHVTRGQEGSEHLVEVQVRAADRGRRDLDDHVVGLLDGGVGDGLDAHVAASLPGQCSHAMPSCRFSTTKQSRRRVSVLRHASTGVRSGCGTYDPGPSTASSSRVISVPAPDGGQPDDHLGLPRGPAAGAQSAAAVRARTRAPRCCRR